MLDNRTHTSQAVCPWPVRLASWLIAFAAGFTLYTSLIGLLSGNALAWYLTFLTCVAASVGVVIVVVYLRLGRLWAYHCLLISSGLAVIAGLTAIKLGILSNYAFHFGYISLIFVLLLLAYGSFSAYMADLRWRVKRSESELWKAP